MIGFLQIFHLCGCFGKRRNDQITKEDPIPKISKADTDNKAWIGYLLGSHEADESIEIPPEVPIHVRKSKDQIKKSKDPTPKKKSKAKAGKFWIRRLTKRNSYPRNGNTTDDFVELLQEYPTPKKKSKAKAVKFWTGRFTKRSKVEPPVMEIIPEDNPIPTNSSPKYINATNEQIELLKYFIRLRSTQAADDNVDSMSVGAAVEEKNAVTSVEAPVVVKKQEHTANWDPVDSRSPTFGFFHMLIIYLFIYILVF